MYRHFYKLLVTLFTCAGFLTVSAQEDYRALHWDMEDGLPHGIVGCMLKDLDGFLWIGSDFGISRFDGNTFTNYYSDNGKNSIAGNNIWGLVEDSLHNIWLGAQDKGYSRFDKKKDSFTNIRFSAPGVYNPFSATSMEVFCFEANTITAYNIHSLQRRVITKFKPSDGSFPGVSTRSAIYDTASNNLWFINLSPGNHWGLLQISLSDLSRSFYPFKCFHGIPGHNHDCEGMKLDRRRNCIWINSTDGLLRFDITKHEYANVTVLDPYTHLKNYNRFVGIDIDPKGRIWMATNPKGLLIYDPESGSVKPLFRDNDPLQQEVAIANLSLYCDREGIVWSGFYAQKGLYQLIPYSRTISQYTASTGDLSNVVLNAVPGEKGKVWMGTLDGLTLFDSFTQSFKVFMEKDMPGVKGKQVVPAGIDTVSHKIWLHTERGIFEVNTISMKGRPVVFTDSLSSPIPNLKMLGPLYYGGYCQYRNGCFVPALAGDSLVLFYLNGLNNVAKQVLAGEKFHPYETCVLDDRLVIHRPDGTSRTFVYKNGSWNRVNTPLDSVNRKRTIFNKGDKTYWLMGDRQILHYSNNFQLLKKYTPGDGLPVNDLYNLITDMEGNLWFFTDHAVFRLSASDDEIRRLTEKDGFTKQNFSPGAAVLRTPNGDIYLAGGITARPGFVIIRPGKFTHSYPGANVYIRDFQINQKSSGSATVLSNTRKLSLRYDENNISVATGIIEYISKGASGFRYRLEGLTTDWQEAPVNYTIRYDGLPPGTYTLLMQAANPMHVYNGPLKKFAFHILPPFWKTWWFIGLVGLAFMVGIYMLFQFRLRQKMMVLDVRQSLHRDLHDDVGATLSSIKIYAELLPENGDRELISRLIRENALEMIDKLEIIAWATNPRHDTVRSFRELLEKYARSVFAGQQTEVVFLIDQGLDNTLMPGNIRQNLFLILKEAINNAVKYAAASRCSISVSIKERKFWLVVQDNGKGFAPSRPEGNGFRNMEQRTRNVGGIFRITSEPGAGTKVEVQLPFPFKIPSIWIRINFRSE